MTQPILPSHDRNYEIHNKEMLAIVRCLEAWRHFLEGAVVKFEIWTDHKNLEYFIKAQKLNRRQARWALYLSRFDFTLKHVPGSKMGKADSLTRRPDQEVGVEKDNEDETLVKPEWLEVRKTEVVEIIVDGVCKGDRSKAPGDSSENQMRLLEGIIYIIYYSVFVSLHR